jgi:nifR3 family TIM-barrel protein
MLASPLKIGQVEIESPFVQAALSGYSDWPMRLLARRHGAAYTLCEVMLDQFLVALKKRARTKHFLYLTEEERPVGGQLMGAEPEQFAAGATKLAEAGFDVVDINFGCPVKKVLGRCRGGYHLGQPEKALEIIHRTRDALPPRVPVTIKMRRGIDDSQQSRDHFFRILEGALGAGVAAVTIHGRTVKQRYEGRSDWDFIAETKRFAGNAVVLGSGDLFTAQDCLNMLRTTGVDGVSVARGAIGNPWIFKQAQAIFSGQPVPPPPSLAEQSEVMREHYAIAEQLYGPRHCGMVMRKFGIRYAALHSEHEQVRAAFAAVRSRDEWDAVLRRWYE